MKKSPNRSLRKAGRTPSKKQSGGKVELRLSFDRATYRQFQSCAEVDLMAPAKWAQQVVLEMMEATLEQIREAKAPPSERAMREQALAELRTALVKQALIVTLNRATLDSFQRLAVRHRCQPEAFLEAVADDLADWLKDWEFRRDMLVRIRGKKKGGAN